MQVKILTAINEENEKLEDTINDWLSKNADIKIHYITQSEAASTDFWSITICIWFEYEEEEAL